MMPDEGEERVLCIVSAAGWHPTALKSPVISSGAHL